jgi:hypothetical protein
MERLYLLICIVLLASCGFSSRYRSPQATSRLSNQHKPNFESQTGGFAVWIPVPVEQNDQIRPSTCVGSARDIHFFFARTNGAYWLVQYCELSDDEMKQLSGNEILDQARRDVLEDAFGTLKQETRITLNGYLGRHIVADSALKTSGMEKPDGTYKARVFLVGNRVYRVATYVFSENWGGNLEKMDEFLESFVLLKR